MWLVLKSFNLKPWNSSNNNNNENRTSRTIWGWVIGTSSTDIVSLLKSHILDCSPMLVQHQGTWTSTVVIPHSENRSRGLKLWTQMGCTQLSDVLYYHIYKHLFFFRNGLKKEHLLYFGSPASFLLKPF